jgi:hypothetical protein
MIQHRGRRATIGAIAAALITVATAAPAWAHVQALPDANYYRSTITSIDPAVAGLDISVINHGESVVLTNQTGKTVTVVGYTGEDYLRFTPSGVDENANSLSAFLNGSLVIQGLPQQYAAGTAQKPPQWHHVSNTPTYTWHDHRVHWMAQQRPPVVAADPHHPHPVFDWAMNLTVNDQPVTVKGQLTWTGTPVLSGLVIAGLVLAGVLVLAGLGLLLLRRRLARTARPIPAPRQESQETAAIKN